MNTIKKFILILMFLLLSANFAYSANWLPVETKNGKLAQIDIDSIKKQDDKMKYTIRRYENNRMVVHTFETNLKTKETKVLNTYNSNKDVKARNGEIDSLILGVESPFKGEKLIDSILDVLQSIDKTLNKDIDWEEYFNKQQLKLGKYWRRNTMFWFSEAKYFASVTLVIAKNGEILYQQCETNNDKYNPTCEKLLEAVDKAFLKFEKFKPLPKEYQGDKIIVVIKFAHKYKFSWKYIDFGKNGIGTMVVAR